MAFKDFPLSQFATVPYPTYSFAGQTVIVTGSNTGLGLEAARHFVRLNAAKVILACRSVLKGEEALRSITQSTGRNVCEVWQVDISNFDSVKAFAARVDGLDRVDVVCENAGIATATYTEVSGMESTIAVNVVGTFLLALLLLPILRKSGQKFGTIPRLVITSSEVHAMCEFNERKSEDLFQELKKNDPKYMAERYLVSKLLEVLVVYELASLMSSGPHSSQKVILNCLNPGFCKSNLSRDAKGLQKLMFGTMKLALGRSSECGSRTIIASACAGEETHGKYMSICEVTESLSKIINSAEGKSVQERVWKDLLVVLEGIQPGISKNI